MLRLLSQTNTFGFLTKANWALAEVHRPFHGKTQSVTLIPGIGIGP